MKHLPTNFLNDGRGFEGLLETIITQYASKSVLSLRKADPPTKVFNFKGRTKIIHTENPFLDYVGSWMERGGRAIFLEAKSTSKPRLSIGGQDGITENQLKWGRHWMVYGAAVGYLWEYNGQVKFFTPGMVEAVLQVRKSLVWEEHGDPVLAGLGYIVHDFVGNLRRHYPD